MARSLLAVIPFPPKNTKAISAVAPMAFKKLFQFSVPPGHTFHFKGGAGKPLERIR
jgi:hypothetical protein